MKAPGPSRSGAPLVVLAATLALVFGPPAYAQSSSASAGPGASQYGEIQSNADAGGIPPALSSSVTTGTGKIGDALSGAGAGEVNEAVSGSAPSNSVPAAGATNTAAGSAGATETAAGSAPVTNTATGSANTVAAAAGLTSLPETGGAPLPVLGAAGACLLGGGLLLVRLRL